MREIIFRGKSAETNDWVYGSCTFLNNGTQIEIENDKTGTHWCYDKIKPETLGQYTGLKDKNGKKIFEGDILIEDDDFIKMLIAYDESRACFVNANAGIILSEGTPLCDIFDYEKCEIIGNTHDNPELSKEL